MGVHRASTPKPYIYENIQIGEEFGPVEGIVSDFQVKTHAYAVDDYSHWYFQGSPFGGRIGHPTLLAWESTPTPRTPDGGANRMPYRGEINDRTYLP